MYKVKYIDIIKVDILRTIEFYLIINSNLLLSIEMKLKDKPEN